MFHVEHDLKKDNLSREAQKTLRKAENVQNNKRKEEIGRQKQA